jgi:hypothetical protein
MGHSKRWRTAGIAAFRDLPCRSSFGNTGPREADLLGVRWAREIVESTCQPIEEKENACARDDSQRETRRRR